MNASALDLLCKHYGIAPDYIDIWGKHHVVSVATRRRLLHAMGVDADTEEATHEALSHAESKTWRRILPPVKVVRAGSRAPDIDLTLPEAHVDQHWHWTLTEESGRRREGEFVPAEFTVHEQRELQGERWRRVAFPLPGLPGIGYHSFEVTGPVVATSMVIIVAPRTCYQPEAISDEGRVWGLAIQLFSVRSRRNWGIGDFTDLTRVLEFAAREGAGVVGLNPLHALFPHNPRHASPYSPSNRLFLNVLYLDVESVPDFAESEEAQRLVASLDLQARLRALRAADLVDYEQVGSLKLDLLERLHRHFRDRHLEFEDSDRARAFREFQTRQGEDLRRHALYEALQAHFYKQDSSTWGWPVWPEPYRNPQSDAVAAFADEHREAVEFFEYLQWQAELQLNAAGRRAFELGLGVGIYQDLAVSVDIGGSEAWASQALYARDARIGSPPDDFNLKGQNWGLLPWIPKQLRDTAYAPFIATLRRNMRAAGALRIDHVMGLLRLFWIPGNGTPADGAYVHYNFEDLLGILTLESRRNQCLIIGEDLGTVPDEVRHALRPSGVLSYRLLYFEKTEEGAFRAPEEYPSQTLVAVTTHDLPTLTGFWSGNDFEWRRRLDLFPSEDMYESQVIGRAEDRARLLLALEREGLLPVGTDVNPASVPQMTTELAHSIHVYLAHTPARLLMVQPEDIFGQTEQVNLPGTTEAHPNWQRKLSLEIESWSEDSCTRTLLAALREIRGSAVQPPPLPTPERPLPTRTWIPRATYRLQFHKDFTLDDAAKLVPYLATLGISHCYASPLIKARPGSAHGYDIVEHNTLNPELGGEPAFERFTDKLQASGMGLLLDVVPNHMGIMGQDNPWWLDVLENGPASTFAEFFDIDWNPLMDELRGKVLLPVLGDHYGNVLDRGELRLVFDDAHGAFAVEYFEHHFPIDPRSYPHIFDHRRAQLAERLGDEHPRVLEFASLMTAFGNLPRRNNTKPEAIAERSRDKEFHKQRLAKLYSRDADTAWYVDEILRDYNGSQDYPADSTLLHKLLETQAWRLASWRVAADEINYRRFFDINDLAALRMENRSVFDATHGLLFELIAAGRLQGLRVDHPDGLFDPAQYFQRIQESVATLIRGGISDTDISIEQTPLYVVAEKIMATDERLPLAWHVHGTTGYDFARVCTGLYVDTDAEHLMDRIYADFIGERVPLSEILFHSKQLIMQEALASELTVLATELSRVAETDTHTRDFTRTGLYYALETIVACFPIYRTYVTSEGPSSTEESYIRQGVEAARRRSVAADATIFDFVRDVLLTRQAEGKDDNYRARVTRFAMKFQQFTSPVTAKGMEDTAYYRYNRLVSLNEVGGEPDHFGISVADFHRANTERRTDWPHSLLSSSTHDTKRSEDVRARISVLSEMPEQWRDHAGRWAEINLAYKEEADGQLAPSFNDEYLLYQTLIGAWPLEPLEEPGVTGFIERMQAYMLKAAREAKQHTSWINPDPQYESAFHNFISAVLDPVANARFLNDFLPFQQRITHIGMLNSLSQTLLKLTSPGVPDIYQGNELWDFSLVDPDNRRPVNFEQRRALLDAFRETFSDDARLTDRLGDLTENMSDGRIKLYLTWKCLTLRRAHPDLFRDGDYMPLQVRGPRAQHLCAFARQQNNLAVIAICPRLIARLMGTDHQTPASPSLWRDTWVEIPDMLAKHKYSHVFTGDELHIDLSNNGYLLPVNKLFSHFPVALLHAL